MKERKINTSYYSLLNPILITSLIRLGSLTAPHSQSCATNLQQWQWRPEPHPHPRQPGQGQGESFDAGQLYVPLRLEGC
ncbi:hypothetical protein HOY82DRAFT_558017 [Tuber indicum]|nr:hypothetical protein HOY82DRAFT_558017 [Tuber indicum]